jgi:transcriptional regulator with XRE-family HTH domain
MPQLHAKHGPEYDALARKLRAARIAAGLTQVQAAEKLGKPQSYVSKCEIGERRVDVVELRAFAEIYGQPMSYFAEDE